MKRVAALCLGLGLVLAGCASTTQTNSTVNQDIGTWSDGEEGAKIHTASNGVCPTELGEFTRTEVSELDVSAAVGHPQIDGICQYLDEDHASMMTAYFYLSDGRNPNEEIQDVADAIAVRWPVVVLEEESKECDLRVQLMLGLIDAYSESLINPGDQTIYIGNGEHGRCVVMDVEQPRAWTYGAVAEKNGHFLKLRITTYLPTDDNHETILAAITAFYDRQSGLEEMLKAAGAE